MSEAVQTLDGWYAYHDFRTMDWVAWKNASAADRRQAMDDLLSLMADWQADAVEKRGSFGAYAVAGHKADLLFIHMRPTLQELNEVKHRFQKSRFADFTKAPYSYISVVELSSYLAKPGVDVDSDPYLQGRLKPTLPSMQYVCFYPMNKRRQGDDNWYMLPLETRREMMKSHGMIGRNYAGKVVQIITGSVGLDDWEWGVTLYSDDALQFKKLVYEMRFDEASARFGEFGPFLVGHRVGEADVARWLTV
ncbi:putative heme-dependent peroxidase YwfI [Alicyclobacillus contaminans]|uniref:hydrogen peroxide-dependent heme synthase n=1 Tax=Alicyclobacillus contaminans TaxID=392016 RepID=UPI00041B9174|nr:hydrogen peroxide-dependent heme synthase [Alicyclobacillus contaminans]GMA49730.1 putative heme-dependent peroxidase YwfI [Alicyclobacillus contaminans]